MTKELALQSFGLGNKEIMVYLACLELGEARVSEIAEKSRIERTNCYSVLAKLINHGLILAVDTGVRKRFVTESPEKIKSILTDRQKEIERIIPELKSIYNLSPKKPKVRFYEGREGIKAIFDEMTETLQTGETHYHCGPIDDKLNQVLGIETVNEIIQKRVDKGIKSRAITNQTPRTEKLAKQRLQGLREVKFLKSVDIPSRMHIFGTKIALMNLGDSLGIVIEDSAIADLMRLFFEAMWAGL